MVYGKSKIVIALPLILWLANIACSIVIIVLYAVLIPQPPTVAEAWFGRLWLIFFPCNITCNALVSCYHLQDLARCPGHQQQSLAVLQNRPHPRRIWNPVHCIDRFEPGRDGD